MNKILMVFFRYRRFFAELVKLFLRYLLAAENNCFESIVNSFSDLCDVNLNYCFLAAKLLHALLMVASALHRPSGFNELRHSLEIAAFSKL